jgi:hypothetical protein
MVQTPPSGMQGGLCLQNITNISVELRLYNDLIISQALNLLETIMFALLLHTENVDNTFLRNVDEPLLNYAAQYCRRYYF